MRFLTYIGCMLLAAVSLAQDVQLSQFHNLGVLINPASAGSAEEDLRATLAYRSQWGSLDEPFVTSLVTAEYNPSAGKRRNNHFGFGLAAFTDKGGTSGYKSATYRGMAAYHVKLDAKKELSFGLEASYNQRTFSLDGLAWDSQFNGVAYDPSLPTFENWNNRAVSNIDFGFGAEFRNMNYRKLAWQAGAALHHYYQDQSTLENGEDLLPTLAQTYFKAQQNKGPLMYRYYGLFQSQNFSAFSTTVGMDVSYRFDYDSKYTSFSSSSAITAGAMYRFRDALVALVGYEYKRQFRLSMSYDFTLSQLRPTTGIGGGPEINFTYLGSFGNKRRRVR